jgi:hypothetical protein
MTTEEMIEQMKPLTMELEYASEPKEGTGEREVAPPEQEAKPRSCARWPRVRPMSRRSCRAPV